MSGLSTALVTGGAGFLGSHLARELQLRYDALDCVDLRSPESGPWRRCLVADVRTALPSLPRYDAVFHLAAAVGGRAGIENGPLGVAANVTVDLAFFDYVARTRPARAAYLSSSAIYPAHPVGATDPSAVHVESDVHAKAAILGRPDGTYGWVKLTGEQLAQVVRERFDVPVLCYRPFTVYGPQQGVDYPVTAIAARALAREDPIILWGSGQQTRDFVFVDDAVAAIAATHDQDPPGGAVNICTGLAATFVDIANAAAAAVGYQPEIVGDCSKPAGVSRRVGSPDLLNTWFTAKTTPSDGVQHVLEWLTSP